MTRAEIRRIVSARSPRCAPGIIAFSVLQLAYEFPTSIEDNQRVAAGIGQDIESGQNGN